MISEYWINTVPELKAAWDEMGDERRTELLDSWRDYAQSGIKLDRLLRGERFVKWADNRGVDVSNDDLALVITGRPLNAEDDLDSRWLERVRKVMD